MRLHLFTLTLNNSSTIKEFVDFYKKRVPNIVIHITDMGSTDNTLDLIKEDCLISKFNDRYKNIDDWKNNCWKNIPMDAFIICNTDEFLDLDPLLFNNCTIVKSKGYNSSSTEELNATDENRNPLYDKYCIFDAGAIKELNFDGPQCNPQGLIKLGEKEVNLFHIKA